MLRRSSAWSGRGIFLLPLVLLVACGGEGSGNGQENPGPRFCSIGGGSGEAVVCDHPGAFVVVTDGGELDCAEAKPGDVCRVDGQTGVAR